MNKIRRAAIAVLVFAMVASVFSAQVVAKEMKVKPYVAQITHDFTNGEATSPQGLVVVLSEDCVVSRDDAGAAGPFRNVSGDGTSKITLTNPSTPIGTAGGEDSSLSLVFKSYKSKLAVKTWWWVDEKGKRIGEKHKG